MPSAQSGNCNGEHDWMAIGPAEWMCTWCNRIFSGPRPPKPRAASTAAEDSKRLEEARLNESGFSFDESPVRE